MNLFSVVFWILLISDLFMIYFRYIFGIVSTSVFVLMFAFFWVYDQKRQTKKERFR